jgi:hypothetical protein
MRQAVALKSSVLHDLACGAVAVARCLDDVMTPT